MKNKNTLTVTFPDYSAFPCQLLGITADSCWIEYADKEAGAQTVWVPKEFVK